MKSVLLCGCGNIGYRHLQAMTQMETPARITIVEPNTASHPRIADLIANHSGGHTIVLGDALPDDPCSFDLAVVATSADTRRAAIEAIIAKHSVRVMVLEKILFQTQSDLDEVGAELAARGIAAFVNCGRRYFPAYRQARDRWADARPLHVEISGAAFGMASNSIHLIDLAEFLNRSELVSLDATGLRPGSVPTKRTGCVEVFGTLKAELANGATLSIDCRDAPQTEFAIAISGEDVAVQINELAREMTEAGQTLPFATKNVSDLTGIYSDALAEGACRLTPYADSARQHGLFLAAILGHLGLTPDAVCPIS